MSLARFATALQSLHNQLDGLMNYRNAGQYHIDNNNAERNVRPTTVQRKNSLSFAASEDDIDCLATYHNIAQTCCIMGVKVLKYLQNFFAKFANDMRDFTNMIPGNLAIN